MQVFPPSRQRVHPQALRAGQADPASRYRERLRTEICPSLSRPLICSDAFRFFDFGCFDGDLMPLRVLKLDLEEALLLGLGLCLATFLVGTFGYAPS